MHIAEYLYLLDFFKPDKIQSGLSDVMVREANDVDYGNKAFFLRVEEGVDIILDIGIYAGDSELLYVECHLYVFKNEVWIEEYDLVYLKKYHKEAVALINFVKDGLKLIQEEINDRELPIKVYDTTKHRYLTARRTTEEEKREAIMFIADFESKELPRLRSEIDSVVTNENNIINKVLEQDSREADMLIDVLLLRFYEDKVDKALIEKNRGEFNKYSELYSYYSQKIKKLNV